jgi:hypothetical protein
MFQALRCKIGWHHWGDLQADDGGAYHTCTYCATRKRFRGSDRPPEAHDHLGLHQ